MNTTPRAPLYAAIAHALQARSNCDKSGNTAWFNKHEVRAILLTKLHMPSGSGIDNGTRLDLEASTPEKLVFKTEFHHLNGGGFYDGWTQHRVTVRPSLCFGLSIAISGNDRNEIKDYLHEVFDTALRAEVEEYPI